MSSPELAWNRLPNEIRIAFASSHQASDVVAALRAIERLQERRSGALLGYLDGCHLQGWEDEFDALRDSAQAVSL